MNNKKKIMYFIGPGRSGSTILSIVLSNYDGISYYGELASFWMLNGIPRDPTTENKLFWEDFVNRRFEYYSKCFSKNYHQNFEHHFALFRFKWLNGKEKQEYIEANKILYTDLFEDSKAEIIIDSSHYPLRGFFLSKLQKDFDIYYIYLYRKPVNVINSFQKKDTEQNYKGVFSANLYYFFVSVLTQIICFFLPSSRKLFVDYNEFVLFPEVTVNKILDFVNFRGERKHDFENLKVPQYIFDGNRLRKKKKLKLIKPGEKMLLNKFEVMLTYIFQSPIIFSNFLRKKGN